MKVQIDNKSMVKEIAGLLAVLFFFIWTYFDVLFGSRTLSTSATTVGSIGFRSIPNRGEIGNTTWLDPGTSAWVAQPLSELTKKIVTGLDFPWWNPFNGFGAPLAANPHAAVFDPTNWVSWLLPEHLEWDGHLLLAYFLGALGTYLLLRVLNNGIVAATFSAIAFIGMGHFSTYGNHSNPVITLCALPWILASLKLIALKKNRLSVFLLAGSIYWCFAAGFPETTLVCSLVSLVYFIVLLLYQNQPARLSLLVRTVIGASIGTLFSSAYLLGLFEFISNSFNTHEPGMGNSNILEPAQAIIAWLTPTIFGRPYSEYLNGGFVGVRSWIGISVAVLAITGASGKRLTNKTVGGLFFFTCGSIILIYSYTTYLGTGVRQLPGIEQIIPAWFLSVAEFCFVIAAGIGVNTLLVSRISIGRMTILLVITLWFLSSNFDLSKNLLVSVPGVELISNLTTPFLIFVSLVTLITLVWNRSFKYRYQFISLVCLLLVATELYGYQQQNHLPQRRFAYDEPVWLKTIKSDSTYSDGDRFFAELAVNFPQTNSAIMTRDIRNLDALYVDRYWSFTKNFLQPSIKTRFVGGPFSEDSEPVYSQIPNNSMARFARVQWLLQGSFPDHSNFGFDNLFRNLLLNDSQQGPKLACLSEKKESCGLELVSSSPIDIDIGDSKSLVLSFVDETSKTSRIETGEISITGLNQDKAEILQSVRTERLNETSGEGSVSNYLTVTNSDVRFLRFKLQIGPNRNARKLLLQGLISQDNTKNRIIFLKNIPEEAVSIFQLNQKPPVASITNDIQVVRSREDAVAWLKSNSMSPESGLLVPTFDPFRKGVVESEDTSLLSNMAGDCDASKILESNFSNNGSVTLKVSATCTGLLTLAEQYYPGVSMTVDGKRKPVFPFNETFVAVPIESGVHTIKFFYHPTYIRWVYLSLGLAFLMVFFVLIKKRLPFEKH